MATAGEEMNGANTEGQLTGKRAFDEAFEGKQNGDGKKVWNLPGGPGDCVFRLIVPVQKVGAIIGRKGEFVKKMCEETKSRIKILDGVDGTTERVVMVSAREDFEAPMNAAMEGFMQIHRRVNEIASDNEHPDLPPGSQEPKGNISSRMLVPAAQAGSLIGRQGANIKQFQEESSAGIRVLPQGDLPLCALVDDRIVEFTGEFHNVHKAVELVIKHLRKFLVDRSVLPLFEMNRSLPAHMQRASMLSPQNGGAMPPEPQFPGAPGLWPGARPAEDLYSQVPQYPGAAPPSSYYGAAPTYELPGQPRQPVFDWPPAQAAPRTQAPYDYQRPPPGYELQRSQGLLGGPGGQTAPLGSVAQQTSPQDYGSQQAVRQAVAAVVGAGAPPVASAQRDVLSLYGKDPGPIQQAPKTEVPAIYTVTHKMQVDLRYAESIIGEKGVIINYVRSESGASVTISETPGTRDQMTVEITGLDPQVKVARAIIEEAIKRGTPAATTPAPTQQTTYPSTITTAPSQAQTYNYSTSYSNEAYDPYKTSVASGLSVGDKSGYSSYLRPVEQAPTATGHRSW